jgi:hypothetical protein
VPWAGVLCEVHCYTRHHACRFYCCGFLAFDAYEYDGRYSHELWRQAATGGQYFFRSTAAPDKWGPVRSLTGRNGVSLNDGRARRLLIAAWNEW